MSDHSTDSPTLPAAGLLAALSRRAGIPGQPLDPSLPAVRHYCLTSDGANNHLTDERAFLDNRQRPLPFLQFARRLADLYHLIFPKKRAWLDETIAWQEEDEVVQATQQFLQRVNEHRFPVDTDCFGLDVDACEWVLWHVPVLPLGFATSYAEEWQFIREPVQLLLRLSYGHYLDEDSRACLAADYPDLAVPADFFFNLDGLLPVLRKMALAGPLAALPDMVAMVLEETGNAWLDFSYEYLVETGAYPHWDTDYQWLAEDWAAAKPIADRVFDLMTWVEAEPAERLKLVMDTLLAAHAGNGTDYHE